MPGQHLFEVGEELARERLIETEAIPHEGVVRRVAVLASQRDDRVARRQMREQETGQQDHRYCRNNLQQSPSDEARVHLPHIAVAAKCSVPLKPWQRVEYASVFDVSTSQTYG